MKNLRYILKRLNSFFMLNDLEILENRKKIKEKNEFETSQNLASIMWCAVHECNTGKSRFD